MSTSHAVGQLADGGRKTEVQKCRSKGTGRQGIVLEHRISLQ